MGTLIAIAVAVTAGQVLLGEGKSTWGILFSIYLLLIYIGFMRKAGMQATNKYLLYTIIATIPFPYLIQYQGKDSVTVTTIFIVWLFCAQILWRLIRRREWGLPRSAATVIPLLLIASFTLSLQAHTRFWNQALRYYIANLSGIILYFLVISNVKTGREVARIAKIILGVLCLQALIAFLQLKVPAAVAPLEVFSPIIDGTRGQVVEGILRATGTVGDYELLAEWFLVGSILSLYLVYETRRFLYMGVMLVCCAGLVFTKTRSDTLLFAAAFCGMFVALKYMGRDRDNTMVKAAGVTVASVAVGLLLFPDALGELVLRLQQFFHSRTPLSPEAINRKEVWSVASSLLREPTTLGAGLHNVELEYSDIGSFHSLYMTLLYKTGFLGLALHLAFYAQLLARGVRRVADRAHGRVWYGRFFLLAACMVLLIDGIKIEYLRYAHTIQFVWLVFGLLTSLCFMRKETDEDTLVPPTAV